MEAVLPAGEKIKPAVSVVIPIYQMETYLEECLCSLQNQTASGFEALMIDDGSTDGSTDIARRFAAEDPRFLYFYQDNSGVSTARNTGLEHATGKYILFVDSDDSVGREYISQLLAAMDGCQMAICNYTERCFSTGEETPKDYDMGTVSLKQYMLAMAKQPDHNYYGVLWNRMFLRSIIEKQHIRFDPQRRYGEDTEFILRYLEHTESICTIPYHGYLYKIDRDNSLSTYKLDSKMRVQRVSAVYRDYMLFWQHMGWYGQYKKLIQYYGAKICFDEAERIDPADIPYLHQKCLWENGITKLDFLFFSSLRKVKRLIRR